MQPKPDQRLFLKLEKDVIDQCFHEQAVQQYALDNNKLKQVLADVGQLHFAPRRHSLTGYPDGAKSQQRLLVQVKVPSWDVLP